MTTRPQVQSWALIGAYGVWRPMRDLMNSDRTSFLGIVAWHGGILQGLMGCGCTRNRGVVCRDCRSPLLTALGIDPEQPHCHSLKIARKETFNCSLIFVGFRVLQSVVGSPNQESASSHGENGTLRSVG
jgi:hypothetical protein